MLFCFIIQTRKLNKKTHYKKACVLQGYASEILSTVGAHTAARLMSAYCWFKKQVAIQEVKKNNGHHLTGIHQNRHPNRWPSKQAPLHKPLLPSYSFLKQSLSPRFRHLFGSICLKLPECDPERIKMESATVLFKNLLIRYGEWHFL